MDSNNRAKKRTLIDRLRHHFCTGTMCRAVAEWCEPHSEQITGFSLLVAFIVLWTGSAILGYSYCSRTHGFGLFVCNHAGALTFGLFLLLVAIACMMAWIFGRTDSLLAAAVFVISSLLAVGVVLWTMPLDAVEWLVSRIRRRG
ncbi:hypothetical protein [Burkholderia sp. MBR-1]|uniref:hypothetical protein n=1 Tax=Burkholderia sp. MBR-1 TaxID=2732364 RepID=UPI0015EE7434|nr:hypothetical protein [Burkholderia sp. MBR-1]QMI49729.1 hypothetical protein MBR110_30100 [Burkholderia sp. MBR-1]